MGDTYGQNKTKEAEKFRADKKKLIEKDAMNLLEFVKKVIDELDPNVTSAKKFQVQVYDQFLNAERHWQEGKITVLPFDNKHGSEGHHVFNEAESEKGDLKEVIKQMAIYARKEGFKTSEHKLEVTHEYCSEWYYILTFVKE